MTSQTPTSTGRTATYTQADGYRSFGEPFQIEQMKPARQTEAMDAFRRALAAALTASKSV